MAKYFKDINTLEELRRQYKELLKKYHPDNANDFSLFSFFLHFFFRFHLHFGHIFLLCCIYQQNEELILKRSCQC